MGSSAGQSEGAQGLLSLSSRKVCNLKRALIDWDGQTGDEAERCTSGVATKREGSPLPIRAMQEADHPEAASKDLWTVFKKNHNSWMRLNQRLSQVQEDTGEVQVMDF